jgi:hypothetical protein
MHAITEQIHDSGIVYSIVYSIGLLPELDHADYQQHKHAAPPLAAACAQLSAAVQSLERPLVAVA